AASQSVSVCAGVEAARKTHGPVEVIEVEPAGVPLAQEPEPSIDDFCSNDPIFDAPEPPQWAEDGAANDTAYEGKPAAPSYGGRGAGEAVSKESQASNS